MILNFAFFAALAALIAADQVPVLTHFEHLSLSPSTIGKIIGHRDFLSEVKEHLNQKLNLIVIDHLKTQDLSFAVRKVDLKPNVDLKLQVESPYETIKTYINNHKIKINVIESDNLEDALNIFSQLHQHSNVILTGKSSLSRTKRDTENEKIEGRNSTYVFGDNCAAFFESVHYVDLAKHQTSNVITLTNIDSSFSCSNESSEQVLTIEFKQNIGLDGASIQKLTLKFKKSNNENYYFLNSSSIELNNSKTHDLVYMGAPYGMETPVNYSFVCTKTTFKVQNKTKDGKSNSKVWFYIQKLQIQPTGVVNINKSEYTFGRVNYCQGFFSSGIWMAITSSLILAFILAFGVSLLMNVKTMDKFDDPKGKPLNIGAEK